MLTVKLNYKIKSTPISSLDNLVVGKKYHWKNTSVINLPTDYADRYTAGIYYSDIESIITLCQEVNLWAAGHTKFIGTDYDLGSPGTGLALYKDYTGVGNAIAGYERFIGEFDFIYKGKDIPPNWNQTLLNTIASCIYELDGEDYYTTQLLEATDQKPVSLSDLTAGYYKSTLSDNKIFGINISQYPEYQGDSVPILLSATYNTSNYWCPYISLGDPNDNSYTKLQHKGTVGSSGAELKVQKDWYSEAYLRIMPSQYKSLEFIGSNTDYGYDCANLSLSYTTGFPDTRGNSFKVTLAHGDTDTWTNRYYTYTLDTQDETSDSPSTQKIATREWVNSEHPKLYKHHLIYYIDGQRHFQFDFVNSSNIQVNTPRQLMTNKNYLIGTLGGIFDPNSGGCMYGPIVEITGTSVIKILLTKYIEYAEVYVSDVAGFDPAEWTATPDTPIFTDTITEM